MPFREGVHLSFVFRRQDGTRDVDEEAAWAHKGGGFLQYPLLFVKTGFKGMFSQLPFGIRMPAPNP